ncbi:MAG: ATP-dependent endonuclease [Thiothrix sp.]|nr:MAG: ATP-dependent endonuclease [Thiothrix sp.]
MRISFIEIKGFRKLQSCRLDLDPKKTLLVGANNSGKTSAMIALRKFLITPKNIDIRDISIQYWSDIEEVGKAWESGGEACINLESLMPSLDIWLDVPIEQIHYVIHILPNIDWAGGYIGVRLQFAIKDIEKLRVDYLSQRSNAKQIEDHAPHHQKPSIAPRTLIEFLDSKLFKYVTLKAYALDSSQLRAPDSKGRAQIQVLSEDTLEIKTEPFKGLIDIREIPAMRDFSAGAPSGLDSDAKSERLTGTLSEHVRSYFNEHIEQLGTMESDDIVAFSAMQQAEDAFDKRLKAGFSPVFQELDIFGIPGSNPNIVINAKFKSLDGLRHDSVVQYRIAEDEKYQRYLPESCAGLGYQNLIAMTFLLIRFRQDWIEPKESVNLEGYTPPAPLQLVMIEEPEAHLHVQVQQVFIKQAYRVLRNHPDLQDKTEFTTQLLVSTHSGHVSHEVDFANIRYFRRLPAESLCLPPTSSVVNLANIFGQDKETERFVKRYIKATDCDLFFADGAIFVEGQAERILVPHFIRHHFPKLWRCYISLIDLGGANAPRLRPLIKALGLTSLVITDLDAAKLTEVPTKKGGTTLRNVKAKPEVGSNQVTTNSTLKEWHPNLINIDDLVALKDEDHSIFIDNEYTLYVAYQKAVVDPTSTAQLKKLIPRTFEDAMVYENFDVLKEISGSSTTNKIKELVASKMLIEDLESELFEIIAKAEKAAFAIDCLMNIEDGSSLKPPPYIQAGLKWLESQLDGNSLLINNVCTNHA